MFGYAPLASVAAGPLRRWCLPLAVALGSIAPSPVLAQGYLDWARSARSVALAGAGAALADDPQAVFHDPAGIAFLAGTHVRAGASVSGDDAALQAVGAGEFGRELDPIVDGGLFLTHAFSRRIHGGLAITSPWSASVEWDDPETFVGRFRATSSRLRTISVQPVVGIRASRDLSAAIGIRAIHADLELERFEQDPALSALGGFGPIALARSDFGLDGVGVGWVAGLHARASPAVSLGLQIRGEVDIDLNGLADFTLVAPDELRQFVLPGADETVGERLDARFVDQNARTTLRLPRVAVLGSAWQVLDRTTLMADVQWGDWSAVEDLELAFEDDDLRNSLPFDYRDAWAYRLGAELRHGAGIVLRLGYSHEESPARATAVAPLLPDADRNAIGAGIGVPWMGGAVDAAYRWTVFEDREGVAFPADRDRADGLYEAAEHRFAVSFRRPL